MIVWQFDPCKFLELNYCFISLNVLLKVELLILTK